jgi:hypothetical protein
MSSSSALVSAGLDGLILVWNSEFLDEDEKLELLGGD